MLEFIKERWCGGIFIPSLTQLGIFVTALKEVVVWQNPPAIAIYNVVEYGRRHMRILQYTSNLSICLHEVNTGEPYPDRVAGILALSAGVPMTKQLPAPSLLVTRALNSTLGTQTYVPPRFLAGIIPTSLVEKYVFWQSENDDITGYEKIPTPDDEDLDDKKKTDLDTPSTRLKITLSKGVDFDKTGFCNSSAEAMIQQIPVLSADHEVEKRDPNRPVLTLLNVLCATPSSLLKRVGMLLSRLDNLAHVLVWSKSQVGSAHVPATIDMIELPRVNLRFTARNETNLDGTTVNRLYSNDYDGLYIATSTEAREIAERLLGGIAHFIVLQNADNDLFVLIPGCALPRRLHMDGAHLSVQVILDRRNQEWIDNIGEVRTYLYPIHNSRSFLVTPSLASSLYLMVMYFITGNYQDVFKMVESCVSEDLSPEEQQIFNQLEFLGNDFHPDAHACRLKLSVVTVGLGADSKMKCPWSIAAEMEEYVKKHIYVSSACRLTTEEEMLLLQLCSPDSRGRLSLTLLNRKAFVTAVTSLASLPKDKTLTVKLGVEKPPIVENMDSGMDTTIFNNHKKLMVSSKLFGAAYSRPEEDLGSGTKTAFSGARALEFINSAVSAGIEMASSRYGFPLIYDLMTGTVAFKVHPNDSPYNWGRMLFRLIPPSDFKTDSAEMSVLKILAECSAIAQHPSIPKFHIDSGMTKIKGMFQGKDAVSRLVDQLHTFLSQEQVKQMIANPRIFEESVPRLAMILSRPESYASHRLWVVPRISDYSQSTFYLDVQNCAAVNIPLKQLQAFATKPLAPIKLETFVVDLSRSHLGLPPVSAALPFDVSTERSSQTHCSVATMNRVKTDVYKYAEKTNTETTPTLIGFTPAEIDSYHTNPGALSKAISQLGKLTKSLNHAMEFDRKSLWNLMNRSLAIATSDERSDTPSSGGPNGEIKFMKFRLGQVSEREPAAWFELLVASILSTTAEHDIRSLNPYMSGVAYKTVTSLTVVAMLTSIRISQTHRALTSLAKLILLLRRVNVANKPDERWKIAQEIKLQASKVALDIANERHYMKMNAANPNFIEFDPRYLVFEFTYSLMLRKSQVILVNKLMDSLLNNKSMCHQMIMGAGKTTVVTPLLALMLADGKSLVTQVVPHALLDFSRGVMREKFAAVVRKPVFTFHFDRGTPITRDLYLKLCKARDSKAVICATPTSVKSFMLKFVEMMKILEEKKFGRKSYNPGNNGFFSAFSLSAIARRFKDQSVLVDIDVDPQDVYYCAEILKLFNTGVLLLDEVDLLLHPLKSELNWPIGQKDPIDYSRSKLGMGLRWDVQWHALDAIFYYSKKKMSVAFKDSREAITILEQIANMIQQGIAAKHMQHTPHLVLLNKHFYHKELKPLMARWMLLYLRNKRLPTVEDKHLLSYMVNGPIKDRQAASAVQVALDDEYMKMLNLNHDILRNFLPHVLGKIDRVSFGLLSKADLKLALENDPNISLARRLAAVPFVGKDIPSRASQFSQPDIVIGLTILAYRYEGLRFTDFENVMMELREQLDSEFGPLHKRPSAIRYKEWVEEAGGKVRGPREGEGDKEGGDAEAFKRAPMGRIGGRGADDIWPLHLLDLKDEHHMTVTFNLLQNIPNVIQYYLDTFVFPLVMEHHHEKISASGQDLGGDMLFGRRVGFSGTPSDLLPEELGQCQYDECVDGQILDYLMSESIVSSRLLNSDWSVTGILNDIATANPPFHVLLDCGALITGMSNLDVAKYLLTHGLPNEFDGVVFLDHKDRKMILMRHGMNVVRLNQSGIPPHRRFSFYDQIHTTGMDIHQCIDARAALTLGKDMTFRDYAQGAFRMRGIGKGQTIELFVIPEVMRLVTDQFKRVQAGLAKASQQQQPPPAPKPNPNSYGSDLLSLADPLSAPTAFTPTNAGPANQGRQLLINVAAWLTINGMKSENMQFRMLCHQSIDNVSRKKAYKMLGTHYRELTQLAFAPRVKEFLPGGGSPSKSPAKGKDQNEIAGDLDVKQENQTILFADDADAIRSVVYAGTGGTANRTKVIGIEKIQQCIDIMTERLDYTVQNSIPIPVPLSDTLRNSVLRRRDFIVSDYDKAVVDKILMVLVNSEGLAKKKFGEPSVAEAAEEDQDMNLQKEQVAEEEVLKEQVSCEYAIF
jgi:hypothetical protein